MVEAYPLQWPAGWPRTPEHKRERARFYERSSSGWSKPVTFDSAGTELYAELDRLGAKGIVLSSNLKLRKDGVPYSNQSRIDDVGVAVYFTLNGKEQSIPCDKWDRAEDNIKAIAKTIQALRGIERWGAKEMVDAAFSGFKALPAPGEASVGVPQYFADCFDDAQVKNRYRELARRLHPDVGGDPTEFSEMQRQYQQRGR